MASPFIPELLDRAVDYLDGTTPDDIRVLLEVFLKTSGQVNWDDNLDAPAAIEMTSTPRVLANARVLKEMIHNGMTEWRLAGRTDEELLELIGSDYSHGARNLVATLFLGLMLHELGHHLYTVSAARVQALIKAAPPAVQEIPPELLALNWNVVEDAFIQAQFRKDYPGLRYNRALAFLQLFGQGQVRTYANRLRKGVSPYNALYYFIIRSYNGHLPEVQRLFDCPQLPWQPDTLEKFDFVESIVDSEVRTKKTYYEFAVLVWRDLQDHKDQLQNPESGDGDGDGDGEGDGDGSDSDGNNQNGGGSASKSSKSKSSKTSKGSSKSDKSQNADADSKGDPKQSSESQGAGSGAGMTEEELRKAVEKAAKEILKRLHEHQHDGESQEKLRAQSDQEDEARRAAALGIATDPLPTESEFALPPFADALYQDCTTWFAKIFNQSDYTLTRLQSGDLSEDLVTEWYTEKNTAIWERTIHARNGRNFQVIFVLDRSGSMGGDRYETSAGILAAMCHAFEDHRIQSAIYVFSSRNVQIKKLDEPATFVNGQSNIMATLEKWSPGGGTDPSDTFMALQADPAYVNDDVKIVFFLTDGDVDHPEPIQESIKELSARGDWYFVPIGINFTAGELARLQSFTEPGVARSYRDADLAHLGEDIFNLIDEEFIK